MSKDRQRRRARAAKQRRQESRPPAPARSLSRGRQAARSLDRFADTRDQLSAIARLTGEWAGIPMPIEGERLVIEPSFALASILTPAPTAVDEDDGWRERNRWYSSRWRCDIIVVERDGEIAHCKVAAFHHLDHALRTMGCSGAWGIEQEQRALQLLGTMVPHHAFKSYLMTGMFLETSKRSRITYIFRRLRPTVAIAAGATDDRLRILCALCMHPIAYYAGSWAGAMCPTDDVIAHLAMMRGDERLFWKRCSQHPPWRPEAGL